MNNTPYLPQNKRTCNLCVGTYYAKGLCKKCYDRASLIINRNTVLEYFGEWKCQACGFEGESYQFDCHHVYPSTKLSSPSQMKGMKRQKVVNELNKCEMLCANCHRTYDAIYTLK